jgi:predicted O-methyltransferase YrrM
MSHGFEAAWAAASDVEGWLTEDQARALWIAAAAVELGRSIVEVGSHRGRSTIVLAHAAQAGVEIVAVDPFDDVRWGGGAETYELFLKSLRAAGVEERVRVVRATSEAAVRDWDGRPLGFVYVDGAHDRPSVLLDIDGWLPRLDDGGQIAVHDAFSSVGVTLALLQRFLGRRDFTYVRAVGSLLVLRKSRTSSVVASLRLIARLPYFARNLLVKIALRRGWRGLCRLLGHAGDTAPY